MGSQPVWIPTSIQLQLRAQPAIRTATPRAPSARCARPETPQSSGHGRRIAHRNIHRLIRAGSRSPSRGPDCRCLSRAGHCPSVTTGSLATPCRSHENRPAIRSSRCRRRYEESLRFPRRLRSYRALRCRRRYEKSLRGPRRLRSYRAVSCRRRYEKSLRCPRRLRSYRAYGSLRGCVACSVSPPLLPTVRPRYLTLTLPSLILIQRRLRLRHLAQKQRTS